MQTTRRVVTAIPLEDITAHQKPMTNCLSVLWILPLEHATTDQVAQPLPVCTFVCAQDPFPSPLHLDGGSLSDWESRGSELTLTILFSHSVIRGAVVCKSCYTSLLCKDPTANAKCDFPKKTASAAFHTAKSATCLAFPIWKTKLDLMKTFTDVRFGETSPISAPIALPQLPLLWANLKVRVGFPESEFALCDWL